MKDLERATGVGRETIRFYIREGLLPEPARPGRNVAWYDVGAGDAAPSRNEVQTLLELDGKLFRPVAGAPPPPVRVGDLAQRTALPVAEIERLARGGAVTLTRRDGERWIEGDDIRIAELWAKMRAAGYSNALGFGPDKIDLYVEFVQALAREELRLFTQGITGRVDTEHARRMAEDGITIVNQLIALLRKRALLRYIREGNVPPGARARRRRRRKPGPAGG
jgi:hypothetical protein